MNGVLLQIQGNLLCKEPCCGPFCKGRGFGTSHSHYQSLCSDPNMPAKCSCLYVSTTESQKAAEPCRKEECGFVVFSSQSTLGYCQIDFPLAFFFIK